MLLLFYARLYHWYKLPLLRVIYCVVAFFLIAWAVVLRDVSIPKIQLFCLSLLAMIEIIFQYKLCRTVPVKKVSENITNPYSSFTLQALEPLFFSRNIKSMIRNLLKRREMQFILHKANIGSTDIAFYDVAKDDVVKEAFAIAKNINGIYVTSMDLFAAYVLLTEQKSHLLFQKHIKIEEFLHIIYWARIDWPQEENPPQARAIFWGEGLFDGVAAGWTIETRKYITDLTYKVIDEKPTLLGRKEEFQTLVAMLNKPTKNNVLLIGDVGAGKTVMVEALALNSYLGFLPGKMYHQRVYQLMINLLIAGIKDIGELEERLETVLTELSHAGNIILFIPDFENVIGSSSFHLDLSGALIPYLKNGKIPVVGTITPSAFKTFVEPAQVFTDLFEIIRIDEPNRNEAIQMLLENVSDIESKNHISITYKAIVASVDLAKRFIQDKVLPGSAAVLLASVAATVAGFGKHIVDEAEIIGKIEQKTRGTIAAPGEQEKALLLHLEEKLHERIVGQDEAVTAIAQAIRRVRSGLAEQNRPISFLFLGPTGVGKTETAKALAAVYFGGEDRTIRLDMSEYTGFNAINRLLGSSSGSNSKGELTEKVYDHPFSLILLDEFEKAHPEILDLFLQVFDDGRLTDNHGKRVSFTNTIVIATSNAGALYIQSQLKQGKEIDHSFLQGLLENLEQEHIFKPELLNRFDGIIVFRPLKEEQIEQIAQLLLTKIQNDLAKQDIDVVFDKSAVAAAAKAGFDSQFGARPLRRYIQDSIEDLIARSVLEGKIQRGNTVRVSANTSGSILIEAGV